MPYLNVPIPDSCLQPATLGRVLSGVAAGHRRRRRVALSTGSGRRRIIRKRGWANLVSRLGASSWRARASGASSQSAARSAPRRSAAEPPWCKNGQIRQRPAV